MNLTINTPMQEKVLRKALALYAGYLIGHESLKDRKEKETALYFLLKKVLSK